MAQVSLSPGFSSFELDIWIADSVTMRVITWVVWYDFRLNMSGTNGRFREI